MKLYRMLSAAFLGLAFIHASSSASAQADQPPPQVLQLIWSMPITLEDVPPPQDGKPYMQPRENGIFLEQAVDHGGRVTALAKHRTFSSAVDILLDDFERDGFQKPTELRLKGTRSNSVLAVVANMLWLKDDALSGRPAIVSMTIDKEGKVWVGGATDFVGDHSHAYVARLDSAGAPMWERQYNAGNFPFIFSMTPASDGNVLVASHDGWFAPSWLAMIAAKDGSVIWQRHIGSGKAVGVVPVGSDAFLVASFDVDRTSSAYDEDIVIIR